jgi:hypothetical protein
MGFEELINLLPDEDDLQGAAIIRYMGIDEHRWV